MKEGYAELLPDLAMENWSVVVIASQVDHLNLVTFHCHVCGPKGESQSHAWDRAWRLPRNFGHGERERERDIYIHLQSCPLQQIGNELPLAWDPSYLSVLVLSPIWSDLVSNVAFTPNSFQFIPFHLGNS